MPSKTASPRLLLLSLCLPLALTGCSGSSSPSAHPSASPAAPTDSATLPVSTSYVVTAGPGVSDKDLRAAITPLSKLPGVVGVRQSGPHQLRVDLTNDELRDKGAALFAALHKLGTISVPS